MAKCEWCDVEILNRVRLCKQCKRKKNLWINYRLTPEEFSRLVAEQAGKCAICGENKPLEVDAQRGTKQVRGLLCRNCNVGIGHFNEDPAVLEAAIAYLAKTAKV